MRNVVLHSLKWVAIGKLLGQTVRWLTTILTVRFLFPEDYAVIAIATFFTSLLWSFSRNGIAVALIREKDISPLMIGEFFTLTIISHVLIFSILQMIAPILASVYGDERLVNVTRVLSLGFLITLIGFIPRTLMNKEMQFKRLSVVDAIAESVGAISTVLFAWQGFGYWAIIFGNLIAEIVRQPGYLIRSNIWIWPTWFTSKIKEIFDFSWKAALQATVVYSIFNLDIAIAGLFFSTTDLGYYQFAVVLAMMPASKVLPLLRQVALPMYSKIQDNGTLVEYYFLKTQRLSAFLLIPVFLGIAAIINTLIPIAFGIKWQPAALVTALYCLSMPLRSLEQLFNPVLKSLNKMNVILVNTAIFAIVLIPSFFIGAQFGIEGMALTWFFSFSFSFYFVSKCSCRVLNIAYVNFLSAIYKPHLVGAVMMALCWVIGEPLVLRIGAWGALFCQIIAGFLIYLLLSFFFMRTELNEFIDLFKRSSHKN